MRTVLQKKLLCKKCKKRKLHLCFNNEYTECSFCGYVNNPNPSKSEKLTLINSKIIGLK